MQPGYFANEDAQTPIAAARRGENLVTVAVRLAEET